jgi:hypothetical protein
MKTLELRILSILAISVVAYFAFALSREAKNGRYQAVMRENNRIVILDTRTGKIWESLPTLEIVERPSIPIQK